MTHRQPLALSTLTGASTSPCTGRILIDFSLSDAQKGFLMSKTTHKKLFTSESVCAGHPDKMADAVSDAILDAILASDPMARAGIETVVGADQISLFGEVKTSAKIDIEKIVRSKIAELGYTNQDWGFWHKSKFNNYLHQQSPEIAQGVDADGAGDQGMMFGYACDETPELMPLPIALAHALTHKIDDVRIQGGLKWLRPDGKAQVTIRYEDGKPVAVEKLVAAVAHSEDVSADQVRADIIEKVFSPVLDKYKFDLPADKNIVVNGTGLWFIPGPESDAGLTGRKIVVDTYGGYARVGGGAFSGKDPSKVDRSGAYAARYIAKNIVAAGLATKCEVGLAYVIGQPKPLMQTIDTFGTATVSEDELYAFQDKLIITDVRGIVDGLGLRKPIYSATSAYGHFGDRDFPWEKIVN